MIFEEGWEGALVEVQRRQSRRVPLMCIIQYDTSDAYETDDGEEWTEPAVIQRREGEALSINISSGGILLMMDWDPHPNGVLKVSVPTPVTFARTPTLARVRWKRQTPYKAQDPLYFVGLQFVL